MTTSTPPTSPISVAHEEAVTAVANLARVAANERDRAKHSAGYIAAGAQYRYPDELIDQLAGFGFHPDRDKRPDLLMPGRVVRAATSLREAYDRMDRSFLEEQRHRHRAESKLVAANLARDKAEENHRRMIREDATLRERLRRLEGSNERYSNENERLRGENAALRRRLDAVQSAVDPAVEPPTQSLRINPLL